MVIRIPLKMKCHSWVLSKTDGITILIVMTFNKEYTHARCVCVKYLELFLFGDCLFTPT